jgi:hypothetical protein
LKKSFKVKDKENDMTGSLFIAKIVLEHYFEQYKQEKPEEGEFKEEEFIDIHDLTQ